MSLTWLCTTRYTRTYVCFLHLHTERTQHTTTRTNTVEGIGFQCAVIILQGVTSLPPPECERYSLYCRALRLNCVRLAKPDLSAPIYTVARERNRAELFFLSEKFLIPGLEGH